MGGRHHGDELLGDVDAQAQAARVDGREVLLQEVLAQVRGIEPDVVQAVLFHLEVNGTGDDVARGQFAALVVRRHEAGAIGQAQDGALAAHGFGDQETALLRVVQAGGMELDELHVANPTARAPGHGNAVARGGVGVAGVAVDLAHATGGQHHGRGRQCFNTVGFDVERVNAVAALRVGGGGTALAQVAVSDQVHRHPAFAHADVGMALDLFQEDIVDGLAGGISRVGDAAHGVATFAGQVQAQRAFGVGRKRHAALDQPLHGSSAVTGDELGRVFIDQARASFLGIAHVGADAVIVAQHADDAALRPGGGGFFQLAFGQHDDRLRLGQVQRHRETGQARANDDDGEL